MIIDLLRWKQNLSLYMHWENMMLPAFLERASTSVEDLIEENEPCDWSDMSMLLHEGQYVE